jgi:hypothetical protein
VRLGGIVDVLDELALLAVRDLRQEFLEVAKAGPAGAVCVEEADACPQQLGPFLGFICKVRATGIAVVGLEAEEALDEVVGAAVYAESS